MSTIHSKANNPNFDSGWELLYGKKPVAEPTPTEDAEKRARLFGELKSCAKEWLGTDQGVTEEARICADLGADSLDEIEMLMSLEEQFEIEIDDTVAQTFLTVGDVLNYLCRVVP